MTAKTSKMRLNLLSLKVLCINKAIMPNPSCNLCITYIKTIQAVFIYISTWDNFSVISYHEGHRAKFEDFATFESAIARYQNADNVQFYRQQSSAAFKKKNKKKT